MKHALTFLILTLGFLSFSQTSPPAKINYQGVARSANGNPFVNQNIGIRFRILQGSSSGTQVFSESQPLSTNALGLFSTQIGAVNSLGSVTWSNGPYFLEVAIDTTGGSSYIPLGTQELVSVPYALYAASAPSPTLSITPGANNTNVLSVGSNTVALPAAAAANLTLTEGGAITINTVSANNYAISTPSVTLTGGTTIFGLPLPSGLAQVFGTYPNYSIAVTPSVSYSNGDGVLHLDSYPGTSPAYAYTANIVPTLTIMPNNVLVSGPQSNSVTLPTASTASLVSSGAAVTTTLGANSYSLDVPTTSISPGSGIAVAGSYPSFTVSATSPATVAPTGLTGQGAANVTPAGTNSFDISVPITTISPGAGISVNGTYPSFTVSSLSQSVSVVANPTLGLAGVSGTFPNYTITVAPGFTYNNSTGSLVVTNSSIPALSYSTYATPNLSLSAGVLWAGPTSNSVTIPTAATPTITGQGVASVTPSGSNFTVSVAPTGVTSADNSATVTPVGTNSFDIAVPPVASVISSDNSATVTSSGTNTFDISVPPPVNITGFGGASVGGSYPNVTINTPQQLNLTTTGGGITQGGTYPNLTLTSPSVNITPSVSVFGVPITGLLQKAGSYPNYSLYVAPNITYDSNTGYLHLDSYPFTSPAYSYSAYITPNLNISNNVIQNGPATNTIAITSPAAQAFAVSGAALLVGTGGTNLFSSSFTKQSASSEIDVFVHVQVSVGAFQLFGSQIVFDLLVDGSASTVSTPHTLIANSQEYITLRSVFSGLGAGSHTVAIRIKTTSGILLTASLDPNSYGGKLILKETY